MIKKPCGGIGCDCKIEVTCPICEGELDLVEKNGPVTYVYCKKCEGIKSFADQPYVNFADYPITERVMKT